MPFSLISSGHSVGYETLNDAPRSSPKSPQKYPGIWSSSSPRTTPIGAPFLVKFLLCLAKSLLVMRLLIYEVPSALRVVESCFTRSSNLFGCEGVCVLLPSSSGFDVRIFLPTNENHPLFLVPVIGLILNRNS
jgi:hypothetical protein